jgi:16S rRNA processing protein RimM
MSKYHIGHITNTHGIRGEVKIYNLSDFNRFFVGAIIYVELKGTKKEFEIERVRQQQKLFIVKFKGIDNINDIEMYKGLPIYSDEEIDDELDEDDYHYHTLIDKPCYKEDLTYIGKVMSIIPVPQGHLLEIETEEGKKVMVPFIEVFVKEVTDEKIIIKPIEGLL